MYGPRRRFEERGLGPPEGRGRQAARTMEITSFNASSSHFSDGEVETQRGLVTCAKSHSKMTAARIQIQDSFP